MPTTPPEADPSSVTHVDEDDLAWWALTCARELILVTDPTLDPIAYVQALATMACAQTLARIHDELRELKSYSKRAGH